MPPIEYISGHIDNPGEALVMIHYPWVHHDGGRATSRRPKAKNDCTVRALALALGLNYDEAYDLLAEQGRKAHRGMAGWREFLEDHGVEGWRFVWHGFPAKKGHSRVNPPEFCDTFREGVWIVQTAKHVNTVIDGLWYDSFATQPFRCIYGAWEVIRA